MGRFQKAIEDSATKDLSFIEGECKATWDLLHREYSEIELDDVTRTIAGFATGAKLAAQNL